MRYFLIVLIIWALSEKSFNQNNSKNFLDEEEKYSVLEGKPVNRIIIRPIDVAGENINGKTGINSDEKPGWFGRLTNSLHFKTRDWVIRNLLLLKEGDQLNISDLSESERILRNSGYFLDARVKAVPVEGNDSVTVLVTTKERWTLTPVISYDTEKKDGYFGLKDDNFIGLGHRIETVVTHDQNTSIGWGAKLNYTASNVLGTFIDAGVVLETNRRFTNQGLNFLRPFITTQTEWAGGLELAWETNNLEIRNSNQSNQVMRYRKSSQDLWLGKSYPVWFGNRNFKSNSRFITSARIGRNIYSIRPAVTSETNRIFENYNIYLFNLGLLNRRFYRDYFIDKFGVTEDIPIGGSLSFTIGSESREFSNRLYLAAELIYSRRIEGIGYISADFGIGGFRRDSHWEQNIFLFNLIYHSQLSRNKPWKIRIVIENELLIGFNRFHGEQIFLDQENGLRGFEDLSLFGNKKNNLNIEARIFSRFSPFGFTLGALVFTDFGLISPPERKLFSSKLYQAYGIGLRTRNESVARTNFEVSLVYNPYNPIKNKSLFKIIFTGTIALGIREFGFAKPSVIPFGNNLQ